ncbi:MAG: PilZ domain-containing protein [Agathobacter sp.]|nr:PilZ domain-containing protein [Agathobacter sp.]
MEEKRRHKRLDLDVNIQLERLDEEGVTTLKYVHVDVTDLSRSGIGFVCARELEKGSFYDTRIRIWTKEVLEVVLEIVRCEKKGDLYQYGASFIGMTDTDALKIDIYQMFNEL